MIFQDKVLLIPDVLIPDAQIRIIPVKYDDFDDYEWDGAESWFQYNGDNIYRVSNGADIMVTSVALSTILSIATHGRMTPQRIWRMAMCDGRLADQTRCWHSFGGIDYYGQIEDGRSDRP